MKKICGFVEVYATSSVVMQSAVVYIKYLNDYLEQTKESSRCKTIAVFKIYLK